MRELTAGRHEAASGKAESMVVFLHGYGANGADLLGLAEPLSAHLPDTLFVAPDAPERCAASPMGYQWFPIPWIDGSSEEAAKAGVLRATEDLAGFLDTLHENEGIAPRKTVLFGFSQGTMLSLHVAPARSPALAGVVGFSGRLLDPAGLAAAVSKPPVLLVHGDQDDVVPPQALPEAAEALQGAGFTVYAHVMRGTGHGIAPDGAGVALQFLRERLYD
jgi:phospholipase/carboxylesterase